MFEANSSSDWIPCLLFGLPPNEDAASFRSKLRAVVEANSFSDSSSRLLVCILVVEGKIPLCPAL